MSDSSSGLPACSYTMKWNSRFRSAYRESSSPSARIWSFRSRRRPIPPASIWWAASDAPSDSRAARIWKVLLDRAIVGLHHGESPVDIPDDQALRLQSPQRFPDRVWLTWNRWAETPHASSLWVAQDA